MSVTDTRSLATTAYDIPSPYTPTLPQSSRTPSTVGDDGIITPAGMPSLSPDLAPPSVLEPPPKHTTRDRLAPTYMLPYESVGEINHDRVDVAVSLDQAPTSADRLLTPATADLHIQPHPQPTAQPHLHPDPPHGSTPVAKHGKEAVQQIIENDDEDSKDGVVVITRTDGVANGTANGSTPSFMLRIPAMAGLSTPTTISRSSSPKPGGKRKRRSDESTSTVVSRPLRARLSSPHTAVSTPTVSKDVSPAPSSIPTLGGGSVVEQSSILSSHPLSIFSVPPPTDDTLPEALQDVIGSSARRRLRERAGDTIMADAAAAEKESRLRPSRGRETGIRSGVSASGRGVRVAASARINAAGPGRKKGKGRAAAAEADVPNQDFCSSCRGNGRFLCCDGCPRSFHFMCLEPPLRIDELPEEETWYCRKCNAEKNGITDTPVRDRDRDPITAVFHQLEKKLDNENPTQFRLPQEIRQFFTGVSAAPRGEYVDSEETRTRYDRKGFQEDRDGTRLRDGKARPVACYKCGGSSIPLRSLSSDPESSWRQIVSCDYCQLHWHLDCLSPPLATMPNSSRKWMCPNHAEQVMPRRRTVRSGLETVEIQMPNQRNNGNIVVVANEEPRQSIEYEDMVINNKRYRVPEKVIRLDFWEKLGLNNGKRIVAPAKLANQAARIHTQTASSSTSELEPQTTAEDIDAAILLFGFAFASGNSRTSEAQTPAVEARAPVGQAQQTLVMVGPETTDARRKITLRVSRPNVNSSS